MGEHYAQHAPATYDGQDDPFMTGGQSSDVVPDADEGYALVEDEQNAIDNFNNGPVDGW